ncbi:hypothetical protein BV372_35135 [Nostoc sp. T09]|uniref:hypothetical protein n=1 Tax=Nostoc sp. T09 TaxID=1932621 RepID=UPI000A3AB0ED|nr:hypothetical protein [Nostoc sp. T09]OUL17434.1 hypothetical protein BV372_35135 [Nostoc sp. T09]
MSDSPGQYNGQPQPSRLEQIELLLLQTTASLNRVSQQQEVNTQAITQLGDKIDRLADRQDSFQVQLEESISELIKTIDYAVDRTEELVRRFLEQSSNGNE